MTGALVTEFLSQAILHDLNVAVLQVDAGLRVLGCSPGLEAGAWRPATDQTSQSILDVFPELIGCEQDLAAVARGHSPRFELPMINRLEADGSQRSYLSLTALPHSAGPGSLILLVQDVTAQGRLDQQVTQRLNEVRLLRGQLEAANARLIRLDADKSAFLRMAAHDLRAPLAVIRGYVELVRDESAQGADAAESLGIVMARVDQMARLIDNLLDVERIESGEVALHRAPVDLALLVNQVVESFSPVAQQKELTLEWDVPADMAHPHADGELLVQVLNNLVSNAIKFTPAGGQVTVRAFRQEAEIVVEVRDTGPGLSEADQARLFQRFFRTDDARRQRTSGTGLGLSIVKAIVEQHGGRISCRSQLGQGSAFGFSLPLKEG